MAFLFLGLKVKLSFSRREKYPQQSMHQQKNKSNTIFNINRIILGIYRLQNAQFVKAQNHFSREACNPANEKNPASTFTEHLPTVSWKTPPTQHSYKTFGSRILIMWLLFCYHLCFRKNEQLSWPCKTCPASSSFTPLLAKINRHPKWEIYVEAHSCLPQKYKSVSPTPSLPPSLPPSHSLPSPRHSFLDSVSIRLIFLFLPSPWKPCSDDAIRTTAFFYFNWITSHDTKRIPWPASQTNPHPLSLRATQCRNMLFAAPAVPPLTCTGMHWWVFPPLLPPTLRQHCYFTIQPHQLLWIACLLACFPSSTFLSARPPPPQPLQHVLAGWGGEGRTHRRLRGARFGKNALH